MGSPKPLWRKCKTWGAPKPKGNLSFWSATWRGWTYIAAAGWHADLMLQERIAFAALCPLPPPGGAGTMGPGLIVPAFAAGFLNWSLREFRDSLEEHRDRVVAIITEGPDAVRLEYAAAALAKQRTA